MALMQIVKNMMSFGLAVDMKFDCKDGVPLKCLGTGTSKTVNFSIFHRWKINVFLAAGKMENQWFLGVPISYM